MTALITGAGGALGSAIAERLAADGQAVAAVDISDQVQSTKVRIEHSGGRAIAVSCDLRDPAQIATAFDRAESELGTVAILINNAAVFPVGRFIDVTLEEWEDTVSVNQRAYFLCAQRAARSMMELGSGAIVNVASIVWHGHWPNISPYTVSKGAIVALTRALARELGPHGIRVNGVAPGAFPTAAERAQHPDLESYEDRILESQALKRRGTSSELAAAVSFLASDEASFITGQTLNVDGGWVMT